MIYNKKLLNLTICIVFNVTNEIIVHCVTVTVFGKRKSMEI